MSKISAQGYRSVEKNPFDLYRWDSSRDLGLVVQGGLGQEQLTRYSIQFGDGSGTGSETDATKAVRGQLLHRFASGLVLEGYADWQDGPDGRDTSTLEAFAGWEEKSWRASLQYGHQDRREVGPGGSDLSLDLLSAFAAVRLSPTVMLIARVDRNFDPVPAGETIDYMPFSDAAKSVFGLVGVEQIRNGYDPIEPRADLNTAENFLYMLHGSEPDPLQAKIFDACLILHAEHTINASTFAALVTGSTLASPYGVIAAAVGTLSGPLHGGANEKVVEMLREIGSPDMVKPWLEAKLQKKEKIWGFGHREYKVKDPRAVILQKLVEEMASQRGLSPLFETALALEEAAAARLGAKGVYPNVDFYSGILYSEMGIPSDQFTSLFAISRAAGWLAHWREQLSDNRIFRPTQVYTGQPIRDYVAITRR